MLLYYNEQAYAGVMADRKNIYVYTGAGQPQVYPNTLGSHFTVRLSNRADRLTIEASSDNVIWHTLPNRPMRLYLHPSSSEQSLTGVFPMRSLQA